MPPPNPPTAPSVLTPTLALQNLRNVLDHAHILMKGQPLTGREFRLVEDSLRCLAGAIAPKKSAPVKTEEAPPAAAAEAPAEPAAPAAAAPAGLSVPSADSLAADPA